MKRSITAVLVTFLVAACAESPTQNDIGPPVLDISDAIHGSGDDSFYWLPPLVPQPSFDGVFDGSLAPTVTICDLGVIAPEAVEPDTPCLTPAGAFPVDFTTTTGPGSETVRVDSESEHYIVDWHTDDFALSDANIYRITVTVSGAELGHADVDVVNSGKDLKNVLTDEFIALKDGRTLPIKFRVESTDAYMVGSDGGSVVAEDGAVVLDIPAGALSGDVGITVEPDVSHPASEGVIAGAAFEFGPDGLVFDQPVSLTITYDEASLPSGFPETGLVLAKQLHDQGDVWRQFPSVVDQATNTVTADISGFSNHVVQKAVASVDVSPATAELGPGDTAQLAATAFDDLGQPLTNQETTWGTADPTVATVDSTGLVTAVGGGSADVTATIGGVSGTATITVTVANPVLAEIGTILGDPFTSDLVSGLTAATGPTMQATLDQCDTAIGQNDETAVAACLANARSQVGGAADPTDQALLAVLDRMLDYAERLLN